MKNSTKKTDKKAASVSATETPVSAPVLTIAMLHSAIARANESYKTRKGLSANINKSGFNPDLAKAHKIVSGLTQAQIDEIVLLSVADKVVAGFSDASNTKKPMRIIQALLFTLTGSGSYLKGSAKTFLLEFCGLVVAGAKTRKGLAFCATAKGDSSTSDEVFSTAKAHQIMKAFGKIGIVTEQTQNSVSFSKGGIADTLGVAKKDSRTGLPVVNLESPIVAKLNEIVSKLTDNSIQLLVAQASQRDNS